MLNCGLQNSDVPEITCHERRFGKRGNKAGFLVKENKTVRPTRSLENTNTTMPRGTVTSTLHTVEIFSRSHPVLEKPASVFVAEARSENEHSRRCERPLSKKTTLEHREQQQQQRD